MSYPVISVLSTSPAHCCPDRCWPTAAHLPKAPPTHNLPTPDDATLDPCMPVHQDPAHRHLHDRQSFLSQPCMNKKRRVVQCTSGFSLHRAVLVTSKSFCSSSSLSASSSCITYNGRAVMQDWLVCHPSKALFFRRGCFITRGYRSRYRQAPDGREEGW